VREQAEDQQRIVRLRQLHPLLARLLAATTDYGRSLTRWAYGCAGVIAVFEVLLGYSMLGLLVAILSRKVMGRS
jgi:hypothetical protein